MIVSAAFAATRQKWSTNNFIESKNAFIFFLTLIAFLSLRLDTGRLVARV
jgi:hypothetical protein